MRSLLFKSCIWCDLLERKDVSKQLVWENAIFFQTTNKQFNSNFHCAIQSRFLILFALIIIIIIWEKCFINDCWVKFVVASSVVFSYFVCCESAQFKILVFKAKTKRGPVIRWKSAFYLSRDFMQRGGAYSRF